MTSSRNLQPFARLYEQRGRKLPPVAVLLLVIIIASLSAQLIWALVPTLTNSRWQAPTLPAPQQTQHRQTDVQAIISQNLFGAYQASLSGDGSAAPETHLSLSLFGLLSSPDSPHPRPLN